MVIIIFLLGRPGSGKSSAARLITNLAQRKNLTTVRINDYDLLYKMYKADTNHTQFVPTKCGTGFDVKDFTVLDSALQQIGIALQRIDEKAKEAPFPDVVIVEFARNDYDNVLKQFDSQLLKTAYFLYLDTDINECYKRILNRVKNPSGNDDHFVSKKILRNYYQQQNFSIRLAQIYGIKRRRVEIIQNNGSYQDFNLYISYFFQSILRHHAVFAAINRFEERVRKILRSLLSRFPTSNKSALALATDKRQYH
jgi:adenylate kinase family enzyme